VVQKEIRRVSIDAVSSCIQIDRLGWGNVWRWFQIIAERGLDHDAWLFRRVISQVVGWTVTVSLCERLLIDRLYPNNRRKSQIEQLYFVLLYLYSSLLLTDTLPVNDVNQQPWHLNTHSSVKPLLPSSSLAYPKVISIDCLSAKRYARIAIHLTSASPG
jgi:hypothetical protein